MTGAPLTVDQRLNEIVKLGFTVSIAYGRCNCERHKGHPGWSVQLFEPGGVEASDMFAGESFEHCIDIAEMESAIKTRPRRSN